MGGSVNKENEPKKQRTYTGSLRREVGGKQTRAPANMHACLNMRVSERSVPDGVHMELVPFAVAAIFIYVLGIPATFFAILRTQRSVVRADSELFSAYGDRTWLREAKADFACIFDVAAQELFPEALIKL